jgi:biopolymer transport protein TolR
MAFSTNGSSAGSGLSSEINVTPLIDILLVMLIIFMVIVPFMPRGLGASIPSADSARAPGEDEDRPILVEIERRAWSVRYVVDGVAVERAELSPQLASALSLRSRRQMLVKADAGLDFGVIARVIDAGQAAGVEGVGLITPGLQGSARQR